MEIAIEVVIFLLTLVFVFYPLVTYKSVESLPPDTDIETQILKLRQRKNRQCPKCGAANPTDARFCSECAIKLTKDR
jgi:hypothetical protein